MDPTKNERLIALLHAQRNEAGIRAHLARDVPEWTASSARLDHLNDQIMHIGASGSSPSVSVGNGLELDLDSRPVEDARFRQLVVDTVRHALLAITGKRRAAPVASAPATGEDRLSQTRDLIREAQAALRQRYPLAVLAAGPPLPAPNTIVLRADRDGRAA